MTDKYCPLRFREFGSQPHDQRCIGEYCAWFEKCSQSHGEPRTDTEDTQTRIRTETDTETEQEPREVDENANDEDTREKLEAEVRKWCGMYAYQADMVWVWLNRQAAITEREREQHWLEIVGASANCNLELTNRIAELQAKLEEAQYDCATCDAKAELEAKVEAYERDYVNPLREQGFTAHAHGIAQALESLTKLADERGDRVDGLQAKLDAHERAAMRIQAEKQTLTDLLDDYVAKNDELQAKVDELESLDDGLLDKYLERGEKIAELTEERDLWNKRYSQAYDYALDLQEQLDKLSSDELHWHSEADFWKRKYELICKALIDLNRNYVHVEDEGMA